MSTTDQQQPQAGEMVEYARCPQCHWYGRPATEKCSCGFPRPHALVVIDELRATVTRQTEQLEQWSAIVNDHSLSAKQIVAKLRTAMKVTNG